LSPLVGSEVELSYAVDEGIGQAHTDAARLRQIIVNLVGNALKFTEKGRVRVCVEADQLDGNALIVLAVSDTGTGIPAADLATIFEEFRQVGGSVGEHQGTGLGLSITQSLVQLLGGTIGVESESGQGSIFTVRIPAVYPV
jgi:signal transduction histidine kinase